ncbi:MAG: hypothetical protein UR15_C0001G0024 [Parcubacteria group bacterium GW2011_GWA2_31_28]|nr:MAG: hypothetical protein UR15_C0001G0024 [Parcubacteria group bacterium GW2011_GWA2_31_28]
MESQGISQSRLHVLARAIWRKAARYLEEKNESDELLSFTNKYNKNCPVFRRISNPLLPSFTYILRFGGQIESLVEEEVERRLPYPAIGYFKQITKRGVPYRMGRAIFWE